MTRGRIGLLLLVLVITGAIAYGFMPKAVEVDAVAVRKGDLAVTVEEEAKTRVRERYVIAAPVAGYARRIGLKAGDTILKGQPLAVLEPSHADNLDPRTRAQLQARAQAADSALSVAHEQANAARAEVELAQQELQRARQLGQANFLSRQAVDQAESRLKLTQASLAAALQSVNVARFDLEATKAALTRVSRLAAGTPGDLITIASPVAGHVLKVTHESEGHVQAGQSLLEVGHPGSLEVEVEVLSTAAVKIAPGTRVRLDRWGGESSLQGQVRVVEPGGFTKVSALGVEEQRVRVMVDITSPHETWQRLGDGYRIEAAFIIWEGKDVQLIPASALFRHEQGWAVFAIEAGRAVLKPVEIGQRNGLLAQVVSGVEVGTQIISHPGDLVSAGRRITVRP